MATGPEALPGGTSSLHSIPQRGGLRSCFILEPVHLALVAGLVVSARAILLSVACLTAIFGRTHARRTMAYRVVRLLLTPSWRRSTDKPDRSRLEESLCAEP